MAGSEAKGAGFGSGRARRPGLVGVVGEGGVDLEATVACWFEVEVEVIVDLGKRGTKAMASMSISAQTRFQSEQGTYLDWG